MIKWLNVTANGQINLGRKHKDGELVVLVKGTFGGGTLNFGYEDKNNAYTVFSSGTPVTAPIEVSIQMANGVEVMVELTGATTPDIDVGISADFFTAAF